VWCGPLLLSAQDAGVGVGTQQATGWGSGCTCLRLTHTHTARDQHAPVHALRAEGAAPCLSVRGDGRWIGGCAMCPVPWRQSRFTATWGAASPFPGHAPPPGAGGGGTPVTAPTGVREPQWQARCWAACGGLAWGVRPCGGSGRPPSAPCLVPFVYATWPPQSRFAAHGLFVPACPSARSSLHVRMP
jgi:hypothetical protein